ncbi:MAG: exodeoxyribonuclease VII large subunit [Paramuribaculum sp.]|nr:exodeoxyribonuclease VII large subunit [Paramuribaculum sp.]MDE6488870.1 exodeoxyribonuclease VII large subunit [Paramuribaculum sp.]
MTSGPITLSKLNRVIATYLQQPALTNVWVVAELMDVRVSRGHCYMELVEKDISTGSVVARMRAAIWASVHAVLSDRFRKATGREFTTGLKVLVCGTVSYHPAYGLSLVINNIDPSYTIGEAERRRREILERLSREGIINDNRSLEWPPTALRIAVISAAGAAGYGDFINQLYHNSSRLRFTTRLFPAVMQGDRTSPTVIAALDSIAAHSDEWDCVVIIRGGGASSDLQAFDDYALASNVAQFPLPVIVGIGHERDVTVLDYVANMRVKTPTAAAEWLISHGERALERVRVLASDIHRVASDRISGARTQLAYLESALSIAPTGAVERANGRLRQATASLGGVGARRIVPELSRLDHILTAVSAARNNIIQRRHDRLDAIEQLLKALSPEATLRRGYSLTLFEGKAVRNASTLPSGAIVTTRVAEGEFKSKKVE